MAQKIIVVLGATGGQGGSVVNTFLGQKGWKIRAVTRDPNSARAKKLQQKGVEVVKADANDKDSLIAAFQNATAIYAVTDFWAPYRMNLSAAEAQDLETAQGRNIADAASTIFTLEHLIWSTLPSGDKTSGGTILVPHFDGKALVDEYIQASPLKDKTTFFWVGFYVGNIHLGPLQPAKFIQNGKTTYTHILPVSPDTIMPALVDHSADVGRLAYAVISQPQKTLGKYIWAANTENYTIGEIFAEVDKSAGIKGAKYLQVTDQTFEDLYGKVGVELGVMFKLWEKYGERDARQEVISLEELGVSRMKSLKEYIKEQDLSAYL